MSLNTSKNIVGVDLSFAETAIVWSDLSGYTYTKFLYERVKLNSKNLKESYDLLYQAIKICGETNPIGLVVLENYSFGSRMLATMGELGGIFKLLLTQLEIPYILVSPTTLKKFITDDGKSQKDKILQQVYKKWGFEAPSSDVADAYGLWVMGNYIKNEKDNYCCLTKRQQECINTVAKANIDILKFGDKLNA